MLEREVFMTGRNLVRVMRMEREIRQLKNEGDLLAFDIAIHGSRLAGIHSDLTLLMFASEDAVEYMAGSLKTGGCSDLLAEVADSPIYDR